MSWLAAIGLAVLAFAVVAFALRLPRMLWSTMAATLVFGLAGYAWQATPDLPAATPRPEARDTNADFDVVAQRREFVNEPQQSRAPLLYTADGMARRGRHAEAAGFLNGIVAEDPQDFEAWLALGNALVDHADGRLTEPATFAYRRAAALQPDNPAPAYFVGRTLIRQGRLAEARAIWMDALAVAPADAPGREALTQRIAALNALMQSATIRQAQ
ncbi:MAG: tetratricopeptide repeat protein [Alteraurantiacibacter sp.]